MKRAAIYARVSTTKQAEADLSMPDQIARCRAYSEAKGWTVVEVFEEPGASALDEDRPVFQRLSDAAKTGSRAIHCIRRSTSGRFASTALSCFRSRRRYRATRWARLCARF
jgi:site-specific DNA recombinase